MILEPGDIVRLKSGGPMMTVVMVNSYEAFCIWHSQSGWPCREFYMIDSLINLNGDPNDLQPWDNRT